MGADTDAQIRCVLYLCLAKLMINVDVKTTQNSVSSVVAID